MYSTKVWQREGSRFIGAIRIEAARLFNFDRCATMVFTVLCNWHTHAVNENNKNGQPDAEPWVYLSNRQIRDCCLGWVARPKIRESVAAMESMRLIRADRSREGHDTKIGYLLDIEEINRQLRSTEDSNEVPTSEAMEQKCHLDGIKMPSTMEQKCHLDGIKMPSLNKEETEEKQKSGTEEEKKAPLPPHPRNGQNYPIGDKQAEAILPLSPTPSPAAGLDVGPGGSLNSDFGVPDLNLLAGIIHREARGRGKPSRGEIRKRLESVACLRDEQPDLTDTLKERVSAIDLSGVGNPKTYLLSIIGKDSFWGEVIDMPCSRVHLARVKRSAAAAPLVYPPPAKEPLGEKIKPLLDRWNSMVCDILQVKAVHRHFPTGEVIEAMTDEYFMSNFETLAKECSRHAEAGTDVCRSLEALFRGKPPKWVGIVEGKYSWLLKPQATGERREMTMGEQILAELTKIEAREAAAAHRLAGEEGGR